MTTFNYANIVVSNQFNPATGKLESRTIQWVGKQDKALISADMMTDLITDKLITEMVGVVFPFGLLRLRVISLDWTNFCFTVMKDGRRAALAERTVRLAALLQRTKSRLLFTCAIWGLADLQADRGALMTWRDLKVFKRRRES